MSFYLEIQPTVTFSMHHRFHAPPCFTGREAAVGSFGDRATTWFQLNCWLVKLAVYVVGCVCSPAFPVLPWQQLSLLQVPDAWWRWLASCGPQGQLLW